MAGLFALLSLAFRGGMGVAERVDNQVTRTKYPSPYPLIPDTNLYYYVDNRGRYRLVSNNRIVYHKSYNPVLIMDEYGNVVYDEKAEKAKKYTKEMENVNKKVEEQLTVRLGYNERTRNEDEPCVFEVKTGRQIATICSSWREEEKYGIRYFYDLYKETKPDCYWFCGGKPYKCDYNSKVPPKEISKEYHDKLVEDTKKLVEQYEKQYDTVLLTNGGNASIINLDDKY